MSLIARSSSQSVTPVGTLCWRYSYIELTLRGGASYVMEKMGQKGRIGLE